MVELIDRRMDRLIDGWMEDFLFINTPVTSCPPLQADRHVAVFQLYSFSNGAGVIMDKRFNNRLHWNGSKKTRDLQDGSIFITNVTFEDKGTYWCKFNRKLIYSENFHLEREYGRQFVMNVVPQSKSVHFSLYINII